MRKYRGNNVGRLRRCCGNGILRLRICGLCNLEIAHMWFTQSRDCAQAISGFWECATQSRDGANSQIADHILTGTSYWTYHQIQVRGGQWKIVGYQDCWVIPQTVCQMGFLGVHGAWEDHTRSHDAWCCFTHSFDCSWTLRYSHQNSEWWICQDRYRYPPFFLSSFLTSLLPWSLFSSSLPTFFTFSLSFSLSILSYFPISSHSSSDIMVTLSRHTITPTSLPPHSLSLSFSLPPTFV